jgi:hypothetical protein
LHRGGSRRSGRDNDDYGFDDDNNGCTDDDNDRGSSANDNHPSPTDHDDAAQHHDHAAVDVNEFDLEHLQHLDDLFDNHHNRSSGRSVV